MKKIRSVLSSLFPSSIHALLCVVLFMASFSRIDSLSLPVFLFRLLTYFPAVLAMLLFLNSGLINFSIGGIVVFGIQFISLLCLRFDMPLILAYLLSVFLLTVLFLCLLKIYHQIYLSFEFMSISILLISIGLSDYIYSRISQTPLVSAIYLDNRLPYAILIPVFFVFVLGLYFFMNYTYSGKKMMYMNRYIYAEYENMILRKSYRYMFSIASFLILTSSLFMLKRTGIPSIHESLDLEYIFLMAGALSHQGLDSHNIILRAFLSSFYTVCIDLIAQQMIANTQARYFVYGFLIFLSYFLSNRKKN